MKFFLLAACVSMACAAAVYPAAPVYTKGPQITIESQSDVRNPDGSSSFSFSGSDGTTREESQAQRAANYGQGNTNQGSTYWISPEGQRITLSWVADENGYQARGDHLPTPPPIPEEIAKMLPLLPKLQEPAAYPAPARYP